MSPLFSELDAENQSHQHFFYLQDKSVTVSLQTREPDHHYVWISGDGNWTRDIAHQMRMRYLCTTELTVFCKLFTCIDYCIWQFLIFLGVGFNA